MAAILQLAYLTAQSYPIVTAGIYGTGVLLAAGRHYAPISGPANAAVQQVITEESQQSHIWVAFFSYIVSVWEYTLALFTYFGDSCGSISTAFFPGIVSAWKYIIAASVSFEEFLTAFGTGIFSDIASAWRYPLMQFTRFAKSFISILGFSSFWDTLNPFGGNSILTHFAKGLEYIWGRASLAFLGLFWTSGITSLSEIKASTWNHVFAPFIGIWHYIPSFFIALQNASTSTITANSAFSLSRSSITTFLACPSRQPYAFHTKRLSGFLKKVTLAAFNTTNTVVTEGISNGDFDWLPRSTFVFLTTLGLISYIQLKIKRRPGASFFVRNYISFVVLIGGGATWRQSAFGIRAEDVSSIAFGYFASMFITEASLDAFIRSSHDFGIAYLNLLARILEFFDGWMRGRFWPKVDIAGRFVLPKVIAISKAIYDSRFVRIVRLKARRMPRATGAILATPLVVAPIMWHHASRVLRTLLYISIPQALLLALRSLWRATVISLFVGLVTTALITGVQARRRRRVTLLKAGLLSMLLSSSFTDLPFIDSGAGSAQDVAVGLVTFASLFRLLWVGAPAPLKYDPNLLNDTVLAQRFAGNNKPSKTPASIQDTEVDETWEPTAPSTPPQESKTQIPTGSLESSTESSVESYSDNSPDTSIQPFSEASPQVSPQIKPTPLAKQASLHRPNSPQLDSDVPSTPKWSSDSAVDSSEEL